MSIPVGAFREVLSYLENELSGTQGRLCRTPAQEQAYYTLKSILKTNSQHNSTTFEQPVRGALLEVGDIIARDGGYHEILGFNTADRAVRYVRLKSTATGATQTVYITATEYVTVRFNGHSDGRR